MTRSRVSLFACTLLALAGCAAGSDVGSSEGAIVGGTPATDPIYDPIGALVSVAPDGTVSPFCTGTLVEEDLVVTAKHCLMLTPPSDEIFFAIGPDGNAPDRLVPVAARFWERTVEDGIMGLGSDIAVLVLAEEVEDIEPVEIGAPAPGIHEAVGYGAQSHFFEPPAPEFGTRQHGTMSLAAIGPDAYWPVLYDGDFDAFAADWGHDGADAAWDGFRLAEGYDAVFRRETVGTAGGDSGGPILRRHDGEWETVGVTSGIVYQSLDHVANFTVYSTFGPEAVNFIEAAEECGGIPREGVCDGNILRTCAEENGDHRGHHDDDDEVEFERGRTRCADTCVQAPTGATCAPTCAVDADCDAIAANGTCEAGTCQWSPLEMCRAEPGGDFACFLCCLGQATDFDLPVCAATCFAPPMGAEPAATGQLASFPEITLPLR